MRNADFLTENVTISTILHFCIISIETVTYKPVLCSRTTVSAAVTENDVAPRD